MANVINLISGPRNISTALMYAFAQRSDMKVLDEPFYGYYLQYARRGTKHPSEKNIIQSMPTGLEEIVSGITKMTSEGHVFVKGMAHHFFTDEPSFILPWKNVILIRHPQKLIASFAKVIEKPTLNDIGIEKATKLFGYLKQNHREPLVIESDELLKNPRRYLEQICIALQIPFDDKMLSWKKGGIPEDGIWAKHWYHNTHQSTGFIKAETAMPPIPKGLEPLLEEAIPLYETLYKKALINDSYATKV